MAVLAHQTANPEVVARQGEDDAYQHGQEGEEAGEKSAQTAQMDHIDGTTHPRGMVGLGIGPGGSYRPAAPVKLETLSLFYKKCLIRKFNWTYVMGHYSLFCYFRAQN